MGVFLIDDLPILSGIKLDQKGMDEQAIFSIETEPETAFDVNKLAAWVQVTVRY